MKIVVTGSLGHISRPLTAELLNKGHEVAVISSDARKRKEIETMGAIAAIGTVADPDFLAETFTGAEVVYCMVPYPDVSQPIDALFNTYIRQAEHYKQAIEQTGVTKVVQLSSVAADMPTGNGLLQYAYEMEQVLNTLPENVAIQFMRPVSFYYNVLAYIPQIKSQGLISTNYGGGDQRPWVSPRDIATFIATAICGPFKGRTISYIFSEMLSCNEIATTLGAAIAIRDLKWEKISDEKALRSFIEAGMHPSTAKAFTELNAGMQDGRIYKDYYRHQPFQGTVKFSAYAHEFAAIFHQSSLNY